MSFLKQLGYIRFRCRTDLEPAIKTHMDTVIKCFADDRVVQQVLPEETIPESHASLSALERWHSLLQGQIRALRLDVEERLGSVVGVTHTPGCKGCMWSGRGYHHTKECDARKRAFLVAKARAEELRVAEAESWKRPSSAMPSSSTPSSPARNGAVQPEFADQHAAPNVEPTIDSAMPDSDATRRMRISTKRPGPGNLEKGGAQKVACCGKTFATALDGHRHRVRAD